MHVLTGTEDDKAYVLFGKVDGSITDRTWHVARILESVRGFGAQVRTDMDTWLEYHVALLFPSLAPALRAAGVDNYRLSRSRVQIRYEDGDGEQEDRRILNVTPTGSCHRVAHCQLRYEQNTLAYLRAWGEG